MGKPKIRFKGYEDDWEQRKLEEYLGVSSHLQRRFRRARAGESHVCRRQA